MTTNEIHDEITKSHGHNRIKVLMDCVEALADRLEEAEREIKDLKNEKQDKPRDPLDWR